MKLESYIFKKLLIKIFIVFFLILLSIIIIYSINYFNFITGFSKIGDLLYRMYPFDLKIIVEILPVLLDTILIAFLSSFLGVFTTVLILPFFNNLLFDLRVIPKILAIIFSIFRTIPSLIIAAILVSVFSVGIFSGFVTLYIISVLMSSKILKEYSEEVNKKYIETAISMGLSKFKIYKLAILENIKKNILSVFFLVLESNIRGASILGLVGAGGIGQVLWRELNHLRYDRVSVIIILLIVVISIVDLISFIFRKKDFNIKLSKNNYFINKYIYLFFYVLMIIITFYYCYSYLNISDSRMLNAHKNLKLMFSGILNPDFSYFNKTILALIDSFIVSIASTLFASMTAIFITFYSIKSFSGKFSAIVFKFLINVIRTFPAIIIAIIFFRGFGPGAISSFFALYIYTTGIISKMFGDVLESIDKNILMSVDSMGISKFISYIKIIFIGYFPEFISIVLLRFEMNIKNSTILGMVGAGGIGQLLVNNIEFRNWNKVSVILINLCILIIIIENISLYIREKIKK